MNDTERDLHEALDRLVRSGPPPGLRSPDVLAAGRRARRRRTRLAVGGAVLSVLVVVGASAALPRILPDRASAPADGSVATQVSPGPFPSGPVREQPAVPGLSPADAQRITRACADAVDGPGTRIGLHPQGGKPALIDDPSAPLLADVLYVHNVVRDAAGTVALLYSPFGLRMTCDVGGWGGPYDAEFAAFGSGLGKPPRYAGSVWIDILGSSATNGYKGNKAWEVVAGGVDGSVARVRVAHGTATATVPVVNGTFLVRFLYEVAPVRAVHHGLTVRAYDAGGTLVGEA